MSQRTYLFVVMESVLIFIYNIFQPLLIGNLYFVTRPDTHDGRSLLSEYWLGQQSIPLPGRNWRLHNSQG